jgi:hypothetical protein
MLLNVKEKYFQADDLRLNQHAAELMAYGLSASSITRYTIERKISVSRLTDLIAKVKAKDPALGSELDREFKILSSRLPFGLNFERHSPEAVELPPARYVREIRCEFYLNEVHSRKETSSFGR